MSLRFQLHFTFWGCLVASMHQLQSESICTLIHEIYLPQYAVRYHRVGTVAARCEILVHIRGYVDMLWVCC